MGYGTIACSLSAISQLRPLNLLKLNRLNLHYAEVTCITVVTCSCLHSEWRISMNGFRSCIFTLPFVKKILCWEPILQAVRVCRKLWCRVWRANMNTNSQVVGVKHETCVRWNCSILRTMLRKDGCSDLPHTTDKDTCLRSSLQCVIPFDPAQL